MGIPSAHVPARRRAGAGALWGAVALGLAAAADPHLPGVATERSPLRVLDVSESVGPAALVPGALAGARDERLLFADGVRSALPGEAPHDLSRGRTRLADALALATTRAEGRDVWLVTDGRDTEGGAIEAAQALAASGSTLWVSAPQPAAADVGIVSAHAAASRGGVRVRVRVATSVAGRARLALRRGIETVDVRVVPLVPGLPAEVDLLDAAPDRAAVVYDVALTPLDGTPDDDPRDDAVSVAAPREDVLVVVLDPEPWDAASFPGGSSGVSMRGESDVAAAEIDAADALVLSNWREIGRAGAERLARFVASGGRLLVFGGPEAYGPGGWRGTAFERLLPLRSAPPEGGGLDLVLAVDRSGSTGEPPVVGGVTALESLVQAVEALLPELPPDARIGVLPFADAPASRPLAPGVVAADDAAALATLRSAVRAIVPGGGTDLVAAIEGACRVLAAGPEARRRRLVLLTDGDPDHAIDEPALARMRTALARARAGFTAIVRGDERAVSELARVGGEGDVVRLEPGAPFAQALVRAYHRAQAGDELVDGPFAVAADPRATDGVTPRLESASRLHALVAAPEAAVLAVARADGRAPLPFHATRSYGAGTVEAFAWGPALEPVGSVVAARRALVGWIAATARLADRAFFGETTAETDGARVVVDGPPSSAAWGSLVLAPQEGSPSSTLLAIARARFAGPMPEGASSDGPWLVRGPDGGPPRPLRLAAHPPAEHLGAGLDEAALLALARAGGGRRLYAGEAPPRTRTRERVPLAPVLAVAAVVLLVADRLRAARRDRVFARVVGAGGARSAPGAVALLACVAATLCGCARRAPPPDLCPVRVEEGGRTYSAASAAQRERILAWIAALAGDGGATTPAEACRALASQGETAVPFLVEALEKDAPIVRARAAYVLGVAKDRRTVPALEAATRDADPVVRYEAAASLLEMEDASGFSVLVDGLSDPDARRRAKCLEVLAEKTGQRFGFDPVGDPAEREEAVRRWRAWLGARAAGP